MNYFININNHLKHFLYGILILFWMIVYWVLIGLLPQISVEFYSNHRANIFYLTIVFSFFFFLLLVFRFLKKINSNSSVSVLLLGIPYLFFLLIMQIAQINIPRLTDVFLIIIGLVLVFILYIKLKNIYQQLFVIFLYCLFLAPVYPILYNNMWYGFTKNSMLEVNQLKEFDLNIIDRNGFKSKLSDYNKQTICVDMWSSSCGNCISSMPDFEKLNLSFTRDKDYKIISLYCPIKKEQTYDWFKEYIDGKFDYNIDYYYIDFESFNKLNIRQFPEFLIIDKNSNLVYRGQISYLPYVSDNIYNKLKFVNEK